ncbi:hypothetical protein K440DRAFT_614724 [Wilcoxina mikolae CBS 423.85]|nr:hypothetical protein K440DRAFT_614724 [Wilcoxina mikolae CBS 423.85]
MSYNISEIAQLLLAVALLAFIIIVSFEIWLVRLALAIISRTPILRRIVPVEVRQETQRVPRFRLLQRRSWWGRGVMVPKT